MIPFDDKFFQMSAVFNGRGQRAKFVVPDILFFLNRLQKVKKGLWQRKISDFIPYT